MGIRFYCPNGHKLNVKEFQAGRKGICPFCGSKIQIPTQSTRKSTKEEKNAMHSEGAAGVTMQSGGVATAVAGDIGGGSAAWPGTAAFPTTPSEPVSMASAPLQPMTFPSAPIQPTPIQSASIQSAPLQSAPIQTAPIQPAPVQTFAPASSAPDPLTEAGDAVWYVRPPSGGQFGPAGKDIMSTWLGEGRISADSLVWREGWRDWQPATQVFPQLAAQGLPAFQGFDPGAAPSSAIISSGYRPAAKRKSKNTQIIIIGVLIVAVLILLIVFVWIILSPGGEKKAAGPGSSEPHVCISRHSDRSDHEDSAVPSTPRNCVQSVCG
jgi:hypothetical protein